MHWRIITVGKPAFPWAQEAMDGYLKRLQHYARTEHVVIKEGPRASVEKQMLAASEKSLRLLLDERGEVRRSTQWAAWIEKQHLAGTKRVCVLIGGADGHSAEMRAAADAIWRLSDLTLQHEVALVVLMEQLYRAHSILRGEPYHRE